MKFTQTERNHYNDQVGKIRTITKYSKPINNLITKFLEFYAVVCNKVLCSPRQASIPHSSSLHLPNAGNR